MAFHLAQFLSEFVNSSHISFAPVNQSVRKEEKSGVRDRFACPVVLFLGILEFVGVLGDTFHVLMVRLHIILKIEKIRGMERNTHGLEVVQ